MPYLNPARYLGPAFVLNKWHNHWVYWLGPLSGGIISGLIYEYIFNPMRHRKIRKCNTENDSASMQSEDDLNYNFDLEKPSVAKFHGSTHNSCKTPTSSLLQSGNYCPSLYARPQQVKLNPAESVYGGTKSLYCKSPTLTRPNLNRSQSVYAKSQTSINHDFGPLRPGPLVPAESLHPMRLTQNSQSSHTQNQNVQNQMQQRSESIYGIRSSMGEQIPNQKPQNRLPQTDNKGYQPIFGTRNNPNCSDGLKYDRAQLTRPESLYGMTGGQRRGQFQSAQSDGSSYGWNSALTPTTQTLRDTCSNQQESSTLPNYTSSSRSQHQQTANERKVSANSNGTPSMINQSNGIYDQKGEGSIPSASVGNSGNNVPLSHQYAMHSARQT